MTIQAATLQSNNVNFGQTKRTPRGHEYETTHIGRTTGATVGLVAGGMGSYHAAKDLKTISGKRMLIKALEMIKMPLNKDFKGEKPRKALGKGILITALAATACSALFGAAIGGTVDSHINNKRCIEADKHPGQK